MKKRLAFSCAGEGFGHIARIVALSEQLKDRFDLIFFVPETVQNFLFTHLGDVTVVTIPSFQFVLKDHGVDYFETSKVNINHVLRFRNITSRIQDQLRELQVDALVCDFEPFVSRAAAGIGLPFLNLNHPGIVLKTFSLSFNGLISRAVARFMTPRAQETLFCSFFNGEVGPIIRKEIREKTTAREDFYLVYTKKDSREKMMNYLAEFPEHNFDVYPRQTGDFADSLSRCKGVIAPAGHQLLSEALYLGKPVLAFPQKNQYEQKINARMLEKSGYGIHGRFFRMKKDMIRFFGKIDGLPSKQNRFERFKFTDDTDYIVDYIAGFVETQTAGEPSRLYRYTYLDTIQEKLDIVQQELSGILQA
ncbi:MAG: glycosyltransferase family protein [Spirochaetales bacterium]|nr:glycosyltransferase family protein [Spirochaetales bacterium]